MRGLCSRHTERDLLMWIRCSLFAVSCMHVICLFSFFLLYACGLLFSLSQFVIVENTASQVKCNLFYRVHPSYQFTHTLFFCLAATFHHSHIILHITHRVCMRPSFLFFFFLSSLLHRSRSVSAVHLFTRVMKTFTQVIWEWREWKRERKEQSNKRHLSVRQGDWCSHPCERP